MHQGRKCTGVNESPDAGPGDALKAASPSLGGSVNAFFSIISRWQGVKTYEGWPKLCNFQCIGGGTLHAFFCLVFGLQCVGKRVAWMQERLQCNVMLAFMGGMLDQGTCLKGRRPAPVYANVCLCAFLHCFYSFNILGEGNGGCSGVCIVLHGMLREVTQRTVPVKTPWNFFFCKHLCSFGRHGLVTR